MTAANSAAQQAGSTWSVPGYMPPPRDAAPAKPYAVTVITNSATNNSELLFSFAGVKVSQAFQYQGATTGSITGLTPLTVYYAIPDASNRRRSPYLILARCLALEPQFLSPARRRSSSGPAHRRSQLAGDARRHRLQAFTFAADFDPGYSTGDPIIFSGPPIRMETLSLSTRPAPAASRALCKWGNSIMRSSIHNPNIVRLAGHTGDAQANAPLTLASATTRQCDAIELALIAGVSHCVEFAQRTDQGWRTGDAIVFGAHRLAGNAITISTIDPNNVSGSLQLGQTYYAVVDPNNRTSCSLQTHWQMPRVCSRFGCHRHRPTCWSLQAPCRRMRRPSSPTCRL